jgi:hypothetical protein
LVCRPRELALALALALVLALVPVQVQDRHDAFPARAVVAVARPAPG